MPLLPASAGNNDKQWIKYALLALFLDTAEEEKDPKVF